nr:hypothetical protein [Massilia aquatica]
MLVFSHIARICWSFMRGITMQPLRRPHWRRCAVSELLEKTLRPFIVGRHVRDQAIQAQNVARVVRQEADRLRHVALAPGRMPQQAADLRLPLIEVMEPAGADDLVAVAQGNRSLQRSTVGQKTANAGEHDVDGLEIRERFFAGLAHHARIAVDGKDARGIGVPHRA